MREIFSPGRSEDSLLFLPEIQEMLLVGFSGLDEGVETLGKDDHVGCFVAHGFWYWDVWDGDGLAGGEDLESKDLAHLIVILEIALPQSRTPAHDAGD
ncbi:hypothetical protein UFOVP510_52 [uncultured Caudovirales phage]|uniref:Uncharacterized protein n=1 Tax=uncultured Caudovirales phage TaxID=2100421 RepID=A0A6J5MP79_9CAUD|nr:hypothetical protein UFOVP510_52 [uncultured Caudovirales phage]